MRISFDGDSSCYLKVSTSIIKAFAREAVLKGLENVDQKIALFRVSQGFQHINFRRAAYILLNLGLLLRDPGKKEVLKKRSKQELGRRIIPSSPNAVCHTCFA